MYFLKSYWNFYENNSWVLKSSKIGPHLVLIFLRRSLFYHYNAVDLKSSKQDFVYARTEYETFTAFPLLLLWKSSPTRTERKKHKKRKHQQQLQEGPWVRLWNIISQFVFIAFTGWWVCSPRRCSSSLFMPSDCSARPIAKAGVSIFLLYALGVSIFHKLCCPLCMSPRLLLKVPSSAAGASIMYHIRGVY